MQRPERKYIAIDLKSFYASVECVERGLDPLTTNLVVADASRTEKTICLAVSPSLKAYGIPGRARLFEVVQASRKYHFDFITATPQMAHYMQVSASIYATYLKYVAPEDIHVYSIDEVFIDATSYLQTYKCDAHELALRMIRDVLSTTGITATAGIGTNLYLAKIAMDIKAKHQQADKDGVRIAELDEIGYRRELWDHEPLKDFWRVGRGIASRLEAVGIRTMGQLARCSMDENWEAWLYRQFGVNAELLIDHAWGWEPCTMEAIKSYKPETHSINSGQVLSEPYPYEKGRLIVREMTDLIALELVEKRVKTDQMMIAIGYDSANVNSSSFHGEVVSGWYGRSTPKPANGSIRLPRHTSSAAVITDAVMELYDRIVDRGLTIRRVNVTASHLLPEEDVATARQLNLFDEAGDDDRERKRQEAIISIRRKYGKNAILKGMNFEEGATTIDRNAQIGGHKA